MLAPMAPPDSSLSTWTRGWHTAPVNGKDTTHPTYRKGSGPSVWPGVGALGMCFTGGFALAMMVDDSVAAPVVAQPSVPFVPGEKRAADLNLSPADLAVVKERAAHCQVLGLRYRSDPLVGTRFTTLTEELGPDFLAVELEGRGHSTLTEHRSQQPVDAVLEFFAARLR